MISKHDQRMEIESQYATIRQHFLPARKRHEASPLNLVLAQPDRYGMTEDDTGVDAWIEATTPLERVRAISQTLTEPRSAAWIADKSCVSEDTARSYLDQLVDTGLLIQHDCERVSKYSPNHSHIRAQSIKDLLDEHNRTELVRLRDDLRVQTKHIEGEERELLEYRIGLVEDAIEQTS